VITNKLTHATIRDWNGSAIVIHADTTAASARIACGVIAPAGTLVPPTPPPPDDALRTTVSAAYGVNLRAGPSSAYRILTILPYRQQVAVLHPPTWNAGFYWSPVRVSRDGRWVDGYVASRFLAAYAGGLEPRPQPEPEGNVRATAGLGLRLREGPGLQYRVLRIVPYGTLLETTGEERTVGSITWARVRYGGLNAWAARTYLEPV
jgi:uncharacterized protein YgiM (DUF1202 family)